MKNGFVLEDVPEARDWMSHALREVFPEIRVHSTGLIDEAARMLAEAGYDIALIDLNLPDGSGIDIIRQIRSLHPHTLCIVVTIYDDDQHMFPALQAGAQGYLLKSQSREHFITRLRGIMDGEPPLSPAIARRLLTYFHPEQAADDVKLTGREKEVLTLIGKGIKLAAVAEMLGITHNTAAGYVKDIYRKLNISSRSEAALEATRMGLIQPQ